MAPYVLTCLNAAVALEPGELLEAYDSAVRGHVRPYPQLGTVVERIGPLTLTHYGTHCVVDHGAGDVAAASIPVTRLVAQVQASAAERVEPVEWRVFAHDAVAPELNAALDAAGFTASRERGVLVGAPAELALPEPPPGWEVRSIRWDEPEARCALDLAARSGPHRVPWRPGARWAGIRISMSGC